jgi:hypothetical protein
MAKPRPTKKPDGWVHVATRISEPELTALETYRDRHGLTSLNGAVRHMIRADAARPKVMVCGYCRAKVVGGAEEMREHVNQRHGGG